MNRLDRREEIGIGDMEKLFGCSVHASLPNDYFALHRVVTLGQPLGAENDLGRAIENVAQRLCGCRPRRQPVAGRARSEARAVAGLRLKILA